MAGLQFWAERLAPQLDIVTAPDFPWGMSGCNIIFGLINLTSTSPDFLWVTGGVACTFLGSST